MGSFSPMDIALILIVILGAAAAGLYFLNKKASKKMAEQQSVIDSNRMVQSIFIIDKKKDYAKNVNLPKMVQEQLPRLMKLRKSYFVQAKIGPQIMTFMCEKKVYNQLPVKKNVKVELVGIYIMGVAGAGQKTDNLQKVAYANSPKQAKGMPRR